jgi:uncharacterized protein YcbX
LRTVAATVTDLTIAPVKGMRVVPLQELELGPTGPAGDRGFALVDAGGGLVATSRTPELLQVVPSWDPAAGALGLRFPDGREVSGVPEPGEHVTVGYYDGRPVSGALAGGPLSDALSDHLGRPVRLMALDPEQTGADDFPVTLMSTASLSALGDALPGGTPDPRRFRMTITIEGAAAWEEHGWAGQEIGVGEVTLRVVDPVPRCVVTTRDPERGRRDAPILKALAELRGKDDVTFGVWCEVVRPGRVRVGDAVGPAVTPAS